MSVIIAIKDKDVVYMGADTQTTAGMKRRTNLNETSFKVVRLDNGILVGFCGRVAAKQAIMSVPDVFTLDENGELTKKHIVQSIIPKLVDNMHDIGDEESGGLDISILLAHKGNLYKIGSGLNVLKRNDYATSGAGLYYVDYVLRTKRELPIRQRLLKALTESAKRTESVGGPYVFINTKDRTFEVVDMGGQNY